MWENLLRISGGALNLSKCLWSLQFWEWHKGRPWLQQMSKDDPHLVMTSSFSPEHNIIHQVDNDSAPIGLGVYMQAPILTKQCWLHDYTIKDATCVISCMRLEHVKSHQDMKTNLKKLLFAAQLNMICDHMATWYLDYHWDGKWAAQSKPLPTRRNMTVQVFYGNTAIASHYVSRLRAEIGADIHHDFLQAKYN